MDDDVLFPSGGLSGQAAIDRVFEQYKLAVETWDRLKARRQLTNSFYATINAAIITTMTATHSVALSPTYISIAGMALCVLWIANIFNYKRLSDDKYIVITRLERHFPSAPFLAESYQVSRPFTLVERLIPATFFVIYALAVLTELFIVHKS